MSNMIVAAVIDTRQVKLYYTDGNTLDIPQGDPRVAVVIEKILPVIRAGGTIEADFTEMSYYREFEQKTNGFVSFFRAAKKAVVDVFKTQEQIEAERNEEGDYIAPVGEFGKDPGLTLTQEQAVSQIIANATPVSSDRFQDSDTTESDTIIAKVDGKVIAGAEMLQSQIKNSVKLGSTVGLENFLKRISAVIDSRRHSIDDLLKFMEKGDLPIADDGSIIIYKVLKRHPTMAEHYVDIHSSKVVQRVGSYVYMDPEMVDPDRRRDCADGLHVARRGYLSQFSGDVCVLAKVAPEDVIAVPEYSADKMRVCGYHILFELSSDAYAKLRQNRSMTDNTEAQRMLGAALSGKHIEVIQRVKITGRLGNGLQIEEVQNATGTHNLDQAPIAKSIDQTEGQAVDPKEIAKQAIKSTVQQTETVRDIYNIILTSYDETHRRKAAQKIMDMKKRRKVSFSKLGLSTKEETTVLSLLGENTALVPTPEPITEPTVDAVDQVMAMVPKAEPVKAGISRKEAARLKFDIMTGKSDLKHRQAATNELTALKKQAKVGWSSLGLPDDTANRIQEVLSEREVVPAAVKAVKQASVQPATKQKVKASSKTKTAPPVSKPVEGETRSQKAQRLYQEGNFQELALLKRQVKVSWALLGFYETQIIAINKALNNG